MLLCSWLLGSLLVSQIGSDSSLPVPANPSTAVRPGQAVPSVTNPATAATSGAGTHEPAAGPARAVQPPAAAARATVPQLLADALSLPPNSPIAGSRVSLTSVVATAPDRARQIEAVHAYWRLVEALGEYRFSHERQQRLARLSAGGGEAAEGQTARAIAAAQVGEAEVQVATAQHDLAETLLLAPGTPLPLPADQPMVGPYRTQFSEMFAGKQAPPRARMLDQTLPLRNRAVESHAAALLAAEDALDAALELHAAGQERLADVVAALDAYLGQQRAFLAAVCRYNHEIADYALAVVSPQTTPEILVGTLIKQNQAAGQAVTPLPTTATLPASYQQSLGSADIRSAIPNRPTRAVRPGTAPRQSSEGAMTLSAEAAAPDNPPSAVPASPLQKDEPQEPRLAPPQESAIPLLPEKPAGRASVRPFNPEPTATAPTAREHSSQKPISAAPLPSEKGAGGEGNSQSTAAPGFAALSPAERTAKLTAALFGDGNLPSPAGQPMPMGTGRVLALPLIDCVRAAPAAGREKAIEAYWTARQIAALHRSLAEQIRWLEALAPKLAAQNPPSSTAMMRLRATRLAVEAQRSDMEASGTAARFELADLAGLGTEKGVPQPASIPFVGRLRLGASASAHSWSRQRLEATIPLRQQAITDHAAAVVQADARRAATTADFLADRSSLPRVLAAVETQARETSVFLQAVSEYNRAIAQYATAILPADVPAEKLAMTLMAE